MAKERKTRNFDFLKKPQPELPSREEVIQKTVELTGQALVITEIPPSVSTSAESEIPKTVENKRKTVKKEPKVRKETPKRQKQALMVEPMPKEKSKVGRRALEDTRKPFTSTITVENKRKLRQLCAEYDIAMSDALNEILAAQFEKRPPKYTV
jgi:hypothetical protein